MTDADRTPTARGPVSPTPSAAVRHRPLDGPGTQLTGGLLRDWQRRSHEASLPLALRQMEAAGNLDNLRLAIAGGHEGYRGPVFMDSDLYKTLEAIGWELGHAESPALREFTAEATALLEKAQQPDGYLNSYIQVTGEPRYSRLMSSHEHYCAGHLIQAAIAHARTQGAETPLLGIARRFADYLVDTFLGGEGGIDGHPIIETALVELYRETGHEPYLRLAAQFIEQRGQGLIGDSGFGRRYLQDWEPVRETAVLYGHAVRALYLEAGVADVAAETGDDGAAGHVGGPVGRHGRHQDLADRRRGFPPLGRVLRRRVRAAAGPGLQRDLRRDRQHPVELAHAAGHRREQVRRPHRARAVQRCRRRDLRRRAAVLLRQPAAAPRRSL